MRSVEPEVFLVARTVPDYRAMDAYLDQVSGTSWLRRKTAVPGGSEAQDLVEFAGKLCYRAWEPGLNLNVTKVREDQDEYLGNILKQGHGSVLEHVSYSFVFLNVSRILTHELVRHRPGVAVSQESMRFVRPGDLPMWVPGWPIAGDEEAAQQVAGFLERAEWLQGWLARRLDVDSAPFTAKKHLTSWIRRFVPDGVATSVLWTANARTLRHVIEVRTAPGAEEEIRLVFGRVARIMASELPAVFGDFEQQDDGSWVPRYRKV